MGEARMIDYWTGNLLNSFLTATAFAEFTWLIILLVLLDERVNSRKRE